MGANTGVEPGPMSPAASDVVDLVVDEHGALDRDDTTRVDQGDIEIEPDRYALPTARGLDRLARLEAQTERLESDLPLRTGRQDGNIDPEPARPDLEGVSGKRQIVVEEHDRVPARADQRHEQGRPPRQQLEPHDTRRAALVVDPVDLGQLDDARSCVLVGQRRHRTRVSERTATGRLAA